MRAMKWIGLIGLVFCTGCAGLGKYATDRGNDFLDCFTALGGIGGPLPGVELHATHCLTTGAGLTSSLKWGIVGRQAGPALLLSNQMGLGLPAVLRLLKSEWSNQFEKDGDLSLLYTYISESDVQSDVYGPRSGMRTSKSVFLFDVTCIPRYAYNYQGSLLFRSNCSGPEYEERRPIEALDLHLDATAALLVGPSVRLGFSPGQFADFVLGFFGLDIAGDDAKPQPPKTTEGDKK
ncbi:MAG: hypothetical protein FJ290_19815 [Planctomycetes bacterium]|nr:hypothetical protein [Planctomycetota bacterium]